MTVLVLEVGCLECGEPTTVFGLYPDVEAAKAAVPEDSREEWCLPSRNVWGGQAMYVIVDVEQGAVAAVAQWDSGGGEGKRGSVRGEL